MYLKKGVLEKFIFIFVYFYNFFLLGFCQGVTKKMFKFCYFLFLKAFEFWENWILLYFNFASFAYTTNKKIFQLYGFWQETHPLWPASNSSKKFVKILQWIKFTIDSMARIIQHVMNIHFWLFFKEKKKV